ncbi:amidohydrolase family protein, partial [bacterium]|nr:amidohydrolase family protein [bacterium]
MQGFMVFAIATFAFDPSILIENVNVIDVINGTVLSEQSVVIEGSRIAEIGSSNRVKASESASKVDGKGKFLIPGLWDMHVHFASADYAPLFVANGVVGVRDMHAHLPFMLLPLRKSVAEGKRIGPKILTAVSMVDGGPPMWGDSLSAPTPEEGRKAVQTLKTKKADFVKIYSGLRPDSFLAICDEAKKVGFDVAGHIPEAVSARDASNAGVRSMEHIFGVLTASATNEKELRDELVASIQGVHAKAFYPLLIRSQLKALDTFSEAKAKDLFALFAKNQTYQCPTLTVHRMFAQLTNTAFTNDPRTKYTPKLIKIAWNQTLEWVSPIAQNASEQKRLYEKTKEVIRLMHEAGVPILAGTDTSNPYCMAGFSLHDELQLLVESGLSPKAALQAATIVPARY